MKAGGSDRLSLASQTSDFARLAEILALRRRSLFAIVGESSMF
jgi:hypothetical protein